MAGGAIVVDHDDDDAALHCLGKRCFQRPHEAYVPPQFYRIPLMRGEKVPGRDFRWMAQLTFKGKDFPGFSKAPLRELDLELESQPEEDEEGAEASTEHTQGAASEVGGSNARLQRSGRDAPQTSSGLAVSAAAPVLRTRLEVFRAVALPQCGGLGDDGRWRWQGPPLSLIVGAKLDWFLTRLGQQHHLQGASQSALGLNDLGATSSKAAPSSTGLRALGEYVDVAPGLAADPSPLAAVTAESPGSLLRSALRITPSARLLLMTPLLGNSLALKLSLDVLPRPRLNIRRVVSLGSAKLSLRASIQADAAGLGLPRWTLRIDWRPADSVEVRRQEPSRSQAAQRMESGLNAASAASQESAAARSSQAGTAPECEGEEFLRVKYTRGFKLNRDCEGVVAGHLDVPTSFSFTNQRSLWGPRPFRIGIDSLRLTQYGATRAPRDPPKTVRRYLRASAHIGKLETIAVVPGHWIDPGFEPGAPGEREFNLEVANTLERQLRGTGWNVLRPDRDAPELQWDAYLNWVSRQTMRGVPVIEIHGQGSMADYRGFVLGVIGDKDAPLSRELAAKFGLFAMDWKELAVPRRGGVIVESFNSDEVLQMAPWHRRWAVNRLATRIADCVERASAPNRKAAADARAAAAAAAPATAAPSIPAPAQSTASLPAPPAPSTASPGTSTVGLAPGAVAVPGAPGVAPAPEVARTLHAPAAAPQAGGPAAQGTGAVAPVIDAASTAKTQTLEPAAIHKAAGKAAVLAHGDLATSAGSIKPRPSGPGPSHDPGPGLLPPTPPTPSSPGHVGPASTYVAQPKLPSLPKPQLWPLSFLLSLPRPGRDQPEWTKPAFPRWPWQQ